MSDLTYDAAIEHLRSAYLAVAKTLEVVREEGLRGDPGDGIVEFELAAWALNDRFRGIR